MQFLSKRTIVPMMALLACILVVTACGPAAPRQNTTSAPTIPTSQVLEATVTPPLAETPVPTAMEPAHPTNTVVPSPTVTLLSPTETIQPSATPQPGIDQEGFGAWCLPENVLVSAANDPLSPPATAEIGKIEKGAMEIRNWPFSVCVFLYTFNQPAPAGLKLEIYDQNQKTPWWITDLTAVEGKPNIVFTRLRHTYIINAPLWDVSYDFTVRSATGTELRRDRVNLHRWEPGLCWQGRKPNPVTLLCPLQQDQHPWDPYYKTPLPTLTPKPGD